MKIAATLEPRAFGTEIHMYVTGVRSGTLCRVYMRGPGRTGVSAGTFRYRWGGEDSAVLSAALDLSRAKALVVRAGNRTFVAPLGTGEAALLDQPQRGGTDVKKTLTTIAALALIGVLAIAGCGSSNDSSSSSGGTYGSGDESTKAASTGSLRRPGQWRSFRPPA